MKQRQYIRLPFFTIPLLLLILNSCTTTYLGRYIAWGSINGPEMQDKFPVHTIEQGTAEAFAFQEDALGAAECKGMLSDIEYLDRDKELKLLPFADFMLETETAGILIIQNDTLILEEYGPGFSRESVMPSFSMSKSVTSLLIGAAIGDGLIGSVNDPISRYLPEFEGEKFTGITIEHLLWMNSGFRHSLGFAPWNDFVRSYFNPNLRTVALTQKVKYPPGEHFTYNNSNTQLLGIILERVTGMSPSKYLSEKIWQHIGTEAEAYWSIDSEKNGFEQMASGFYARPLDYARLGRLVLHKGAWKGKQIIDEGWIDRSTTTDPAREPLRDYYLVKKKNEDDWFADFFLNRNGYYAYHWWGFHNDAGSNMVYAAGMYGQYLFIDPDKNLMILRFGNDTETVYSWPGIFKRIAEQM